MSDLYSDEDKNAAIICMEHALRNVEDISDFDWHALYTGFARYRAASIEASEAEVARLREALEPFAKIVPSSFAAQDGSEAEEYCAIIKGRFGNPADFTGADLARARAALSPVGGEIGK